MDMAANGGKDPVYRAYVEVIKQGLTFTLLRWLLLQDLVSLNGKSTKWPYIQQKIALTKYNNTFGWYSLMFVSSFLWSETLHLLLG